MVFSTLSKLTAALTIAAQLVSCAPTDSTMTQALNSHNNYRARHHVAGVRWNQDLANHAQGLSQTCVFGHSKMQGTGQNIGMGYESMEAAVNAWYDEVSNYDFNTGASSNDQEILHFTQVVWKGTTEIGCGATSCSNGVFYVCNYGPPGNYQGEYLANVFKQ